MKIQTDSEESEENFCFSKKTIDNTLIELNGARQVRFSVYTDILNTIFESGHICEGILSDFLSFAHNIRNY